MNEQVACTNIRAVSGRTPLMAAAIQNNPQIIRLLVERGAKVDIKDDCGRNIYDLMKIFVTEDVIAFNGLSELLKGKGLEEVVSTNEKEMTDIKRHMEQRVYVQPALGSYSVLSIDSNGVKLTFKSFH
ncbi:hypothetical protein D5R81_18235 [Parashewanella spongiae]|uniref:Uncharacterized protein n=1 Tax=Parashewanella spongiae TaxID=342950 RepID=A0A3A6TGK4_9GAMM|nr:ankyrin repeat domain-containing protein [Parashewanella spongiae]MCL1080007.1 ankyrin repeat domain-containing protein [Parashewanella spongiae]RJY06002.1 hypothetical protein D5R81_18235 [Parashewanella spongiae]